MRPAKDAIPRELNTGFFSLQHQTIDTARIGITSWTYVMY